MDCKVSRNLAYQAVAVFVLPVAGYSFYIYARDHTINSLVGGIVCTVLAIVCLVRSLIRRDKEVPLLEQKFIQTNPMYT